MIRAFRCPRRRGPWLRPRRLAGIMAVLILTGACTPAAQEVGLNGVLTVLQPRHDFSLARLPDDWMVIGETDGEAPSVRSRQGETYLEWVSGGGSLALARRVDARLLATPYLAWKWNLLGDRRTRHPFRITIGLADKVEQSMFGSLGRMMGTELPVFSRSISLSWDASALRRGSLEVPNVARGKRPMARYVVRGGGENLSRWWPETVDLSRIHAKAWPGLDMRDTRIVFVSLVMAPGPSGPAARLSSLRLSR